MLATRMRMSGAADFYPYKINQSCRFNDDDSSHLSLLNDTATDEKKKTTSIWFKRSNLGTIQHLAHTYFNGTNYEWFGINATNQLDWAMYISGDYIQFLSTQFLRDVGGWYHLLFVKDTTEAIQLDRAKIYCNGIEITEWTTHVCGLALNATTGYVFEQNGLTTYIGRSIAYGTYYDGYMSETQHIDGQALTPSSFGQEKNGIWIPKRYTGTYGNNGFYLNFADSADLGNDVSGNGNDFTSSGLASNDQVLDSPTNNYPTLSSINKSTQITLSNGGLNCQANVGNWTTVLATMVLPLTGKWYFEYKLGTDLLYLGIGVQQANCDDTDLITAGNKQIGDDATGWCFWCDGNDVEYELKYNGGTTILTGATPAAYDVMQIALDIDAGKVWFGANDTWLSSGNPVAGTDEIASGLVGNLVAGISNYTYVDAAAYINFGQLGFTHTPPTGFKALCSNNIPTPTIKNSSTGFDVITYEGNATVRDITDLNFDISTGGLVWIKNRDAGDSHRLVDTVRGATKELYSDLDFAQVQDSNGLTAFLSNGFSLGTGANGYNDNAESFVAWCFRMGSKFGFDIQKYTGTGVAHAENHDLGGVPELMIVKNLESVYGWFSYHHHMLTKTNPEDFYGVMDTAAAWLDNVVIWNDVVPTSTQFTVGTYEGVNENLKDHAAYLWRSIPGFSKVFSYTGNGNADGTFVYCGFRPRYILQFNAQVGYGWVLWDTKRNTYNLVENYLTADIPIVESTYAGITLDILSNGFKFRGTHPAVNQAATLFGGIAYAEQPGKWSNAR